jgi:hypothetical protein
MREQNELRYRKILMNSGRTHWCRRAKSKWPAFRCRKKIKEKNGYGAITVKDVAGDTDMEKCASVDLEVKW